MCVEHRWSRDNKRLPTNHSRSSWKDDTREGFRPTVDEYKLENWRGTTVGADLIF